MREVQVVAWCDNAHTSQVRATHERRLSVDGGKVVLLDLCEACDSTFVRDVMPYAERGAPVDKVTLAAVDASANSTTCPECGFVSKSRGALGQHLSKKHSKGFKDYRSA